ncbi:hypothetical protein FB451DRAFT_1565664 [Mycena latifolia]|nr:hypothetical protein FB451DRAFT_1565664 [Mycena latifolia]
MAEIVGLVASVLQLVNVVASARFYIKHFRDAPKDQQRLLGEIQNLEPLIRELDKRITRNQMYGWIHGLQEFQEPLLQLKATMERLNKKLDSAGFSNFSGRLTWPVWGKEDIEDGLNTIERSKSLLIAWLGMDIWSVSSTLECFSCLLDILFTLLDTAEERRIDQSYVAKSLRDVVRNQEHYHDFAERDKIIEWLSPLNFFLRQADIFSTRQPGTGEWLLNDELFKKWKSGAGNTLWCRGMPGAGKTVLASIVVDHLRTTDRSIPLTGVAVIYLNHQENEIQTLANLLAGLSRQFSTYPSRPVRELYEKHREQHTRPSLEEVNLILRSTISDFDRVFIIVDAIDEYPEEQRYTLLRYLSSLTALRTTVNLMVTSRPHINLSYVVGKPVYLEIRAKEDDIRRYVAEILKSSRLSRHIMNCPSLQEEIEEKIVRRSDGMFLLAKLHIDSLRTKHSIKAVRDALKSMPSDLKSTYDEVVGRINRQSEDDKKLAWRILAWVTNAKRPLRPAELREALAVEPGAAGLDPDNLPDMDTILSVCAGLVVINEADKRIRLIHYTMQNYFDDIQPTTFPQATTEITMVCITYLSSDIFSQHLHDPMSLFRQYSFLDYAVEYGLAHARGSPESDIRDLLLSFLGNSSVWWKLWNWKCSYENRRKSAGSLWIAAAFHLDEICRCLIKEGGGGRVLQKAAFDGLTDMVEILLTNGVHPDGTPPGKTGGNGRALQAASARGHTQIICLLLDHGADIDFPCRLGTALQMAAFFGHMESVSLLISRGANLDMAGEPYGTALAAASLRNNYIIVKILLEHGANIDLKSERFGSALQAASRAGHKAIYDLLIEHGATADVAFMGSLSPSFNSHVPQQKPFSSTAPIYRAAIPGSFHIHSMPLNIQQRRSQSSSHTTTPKQSSSMQDMEALFTSVTASFNRQYPP